MIFRTDLTKVLEKWIQQNDRIILFIDANEDLNIGPLVKIFRKLHLKDAIRERTGVKGPNTFHQGGHQIDGVFITPDIDCVGACFLPFWSGIGDHRVIVIDIPNQVIFGEQLLTIVRPTGRKLRCENKKSVTKYTRELIHQLIKYTK